MDALPLLRVEVAGLQVPSDAGRCRGCLRADTHLVGGDVLAGDDAEGLLAHGHDHAGRQGLPHGEGVRADPRGGLRCSVTARTRGELLAGRCQGQRPRAVRPDRDDGRRVAEEVRRRKVRHCTFLRSTVEGDVLRERRRTGQRRGVRAGVADQARDHRVIPGLRQGGHLIGGQSAERARTHRDRHRRARRLGRCRKLLGRTRHHGDRDAGTNDDCSRCSHENVPHDARVCVVGQVQAREGSTRLHLTVVAVADDGRGTRAVRKRGPRAWTGSTNRARPHIHRVPSAGVEVPFRQYALFRASCVAMCSK
ncbi:hypothetical protein BACI9J_540002 [Bacillus altitudinis]|nr:hypothetical protein BACI9J_540002 [Bacillus altitudinis]